MIAKVKRKMQTTLHCHSMSTWQHYHGYRITGRAQPDPVPWPMCSECGQRITMADATYWTAEIVGRAGVQTLPGYCAKRLGVIR